LSKVAAVDSKVPGSICEYFLPDLLQEPTNRLTVDLVKASQPDPRTRPGSVDLEPTDPRHPFSDLRQQPTPGPLLSAGPLSLRPDPVPVRPPTQTSRSESQYPDPRPDLSFWTSKSTATLPRVLLSTPVSYRTSSVFLSSRMSACSFAVCFASSFFLPVCASHACICITV
jgi:hypothetical protein